ncbi:MAG: dTMP kinase [Bdellovibrionota bacterium]
MATTFEEVILAGKLIVISGIDGSGKTTLQNKLYDHLQVAGHKVIKTRQPTDFYRKNPHVRSFLDSGTSQVSKETIALIAAADRMVHIEETIRPALESDIWVISDRYVFSTYAYFKARGVDPSFTKTLNQYVPEPDITLFLKIPAEKAIARVIQRDGNKLKFEEKSSSYLANVQDHLLESLPENALILDAMRPPEDLLQNCIAYIETYLSDRTV